MTTLEEKRKALAKRDAMNMLDSIRMHIQVMATSYSEEHYSLILAELDDIEDVTILEKNVIHLLRELR